ncbi:unnamed protein product [Lasius platythorax]|uniref:Secreted protein n=1 Tax=Lasius platythorax TaxID=488582 RepID=A0AAV2NP54_9HYME
MTFPLGTLSARMIADIITRTTVLFASCNATVDDRDCKLFLGRSRGDDRTTFVRRSIEAQRCCWPSAHNPIIRRSADHRKRESGFPVKGIVHRRTSVAHAGVGCLKRRKLSKAWCRRHVSVECKHEGQDSSALGTVDENGRARITRVTSP